MYITAQQLKNTFAAAGVEQDLLITAHRGVCSAIYITALRMKISHASAEIEHGLLITAHREVCSAIYITAQLCFFSLNQLQTLYITAEPRLCCYACIFQRIGKHGRRRL